MKTDLCSRCQKKEEKKNKILIRSIVVVGYVVEIDRSCIVSKYEIFRVFTECLGRDKFEIGSEIRPVLENGTRREVDKSDLIFLPFAGDRHELRRLVEGYVIDVRGEVLDFLDRLRIDLVGFLVDPVDIHDSSLRSC